MNKVQTETKLKKRSTAARHAARLAAVQALYQWDQTRLPLLEIREEFLLHRPRLAMDGGNDMAMETSYFTALVGTAEERLEAIDQLILSALHRGWDLPRLEPLLRNILRVGCAEFLLDKGTPPAVIINEYVIVAKEFYGGKEPGFVNGLLENIARAIGIELRTAREAVSQQDRQFNQAAIEEIKTEH